MNRDINKRRDQCLLSSSPMSDLLNIDTQQAQPRNKTLLYLIRDAEAHQVNLASQMHDLRTKNSTAISSN